MSLHNLPIFHNSPSPSLISQTLHTNHPTPSPQDPPPGLYTPPPPNTILHSSTFVTLYTPLPNHSSPIFNPTIRATSPPLKQTNCVPHLQPTNCQPYRWPNNCSYLLMNLLLI